MKPPKLTILLASPRGFCAGVDRAIQIVEESLKKYGTPVYVRHEIVHNKYVVKQLERKGAVFVEDLDEVPENVPVIFSAHGVPKSVPIEAERRNLTYFDATCPLVSKVHLGAERNYNDGRHVILIGHAGHPEVIGTMGQLADGAITLVESVKDALRLSIPANTPLSFITQTTLSVDDTSEIITVLRARFPHIKGPAKKDICYATTNRQDAVKAIAERCDGLIVIGAPNSSNSQRLVEVAKNKGCIESLLIQRVNDIDWKWIGNKNTLGITAGASAPELLVEEVIREFRKRFTITIEEVTIAKEELKFKLPQVLMA